ncbi:MAG: hypothetical protein DRJ51_00120 [Thermoprotei archaeon]|nr:MAG: hypothetical protein DRJ51_00120 [Thermoprotei archaeon]RLF03527.1 MAG: hypothetical protein DRJ59_00450 [Thermoprotei archaeon]
MIILATGISGSGRLDYIKKVRSLAGDRLTIRDIGSLMFEKSEQLGIKIREDKILDMDHFALNYLRATIFEELLKEANEYRGLSEKDLIISTHACFRWKKHLVPGFNFYYLNRLEPDIYVTIIDNAHHIKARLEARPQWKGKLTLKDIIIWRDEEVFITDMLAQYQNKPHYIIARNMGPEVLFNIIYNIERRKKEGKAPQLKAYLSYPITFMKQQKGWFEQKEDFKRELEKLGIVIFDPMSIEELDLVSMATQAIHNGEDKVLIETEEASTYISVSEIEEAKNDIVDQVVARDYQLIDQADIIIVFYPTNMLSPGVLSEINYGFTHNKEVYAYFPYEVSPFFSYYTTKIFKIMDEMFDFFRSSKNVSSSGST